MTWNPFSARVLSTSAPASIISLESWLLEPPTVSAISVMALACRLVVSETESTGTDTGYLRQVGLQGKLDESRSASVKGAYPGTSAVPACFGGLS